MDTKETLELYFVPFSLVDIWPRISGKYEYFGFSDKITDAQKYDEYTWINEQFRKFVGTKKALIMKHIYDLEKMHKYVESLLVDCPEKTSGETVRPWLVYTALRDEWLRTLLYTIKMLMEEENGTYGIE